MPVFHFHIRESGGLIADEEGVEVESLEAAHRDAVEGARSIMAHAILSGWLSLDQQFEVADESGRVVLVVSSQRPSSAPATAPPRQREPERRSRSGRELDLVRAAIRIIR